MGELPGQGGCVPGNFPCECGDGHERDPSPSSGAPSERGAEEEEVKTPVCPPEPPAFVICRGLRMGGEQGVRKEILPG